MTTLLSLHTDFPVLLFLLQLSLWCCLKRASAMVNLTQSLRFPDKPAEALPSSPNTSVTAPQPKQATAMKNVLAGFGSGVSKPPNRSSPAPAAAQNAQNANQAPNPASAFSGLVNNISNSAKKQEQGSFEQIFFWIRSLPTSLKLEWTCWDEMLNPPKIFTKRDQIFDWNHYLGHPHLVKRCRDISKLSKRLRAWCQTTPSLIWLFFRLSLFYLHHPFVSFSPLSLFLCTTHPPTMNIHRTSPSKSDFNRFYEAGKLKILNLGTKLLFPRQWACALWSPWNIFQIAPSFTTQLHISQSQA